MNARHGPLSLTVIVMLAGACAADGSSRQDDMHADAGSPYEPVFHATHCTLDPDLHARCGQLEVPQSREHPKDRVIRLFVEILPAKAPPDPPLAPLVVLAGGPGAAPWAYPELEGVRMQRDVILLHQRGTGLSDPRLDCADPAALSACAERLRARDIDPAAYGTENAAQDVEDLRVALGLEQLDLLGLSYGTELALEVMRRYPQRVRSAVLGATLPPQVDFYAERSANLDAALDALFAACAADPACPLANPKQSFLDLVAQLDREPEDYLAIDADGHEKSVHVDGAAIAPLLLDSMYRTDRIPDFPAWLLDLQTAEGREATFAGMQSAPDDDSLGVYLSVTCRGEVAVTDRAHSPAPPAYLRGEDVGFQELQRACEVWDVGSAPERTRQPVRVDVPTLLITGELDPVTPPRWARLVADGLLHSHAVEFRGAGHDAVFQPCALELIGHFLADPTADPGDACDEVAPIEWNTP